MKTRQEEAAGDPDEGRPVSRERSERKRPFQENGWKAKEGLQEIGLDTKSVTSEQRQKTVFYTTNIILPTECNLGDLSTALGQRKFFFCFLEQRCF